MASLASIIIRFTADLAGFSSQMQNASRQIAAAGRQMQSIGQNLSLFVTGPIVLAGGAAIKFASDYNESLNKVDVAFKSSSKEVKAFAKNTLQTSGIAEGSALDMASNFGDMSTSMGLSTKAAAKMSTSLVTLAGDLSSFKNIGIEQSQTALTGVFTGETESLKRLGIVMTEVNLQAFSYSQGIQTRIQDMGQAEKVQLRYNYIMSVTKNAQGDFARTSGGAANQMRIFQESLKQLAQQFGAIILPAFTSMIKIVNDAITSFGGLSEGTKKTIVIIAGIAAALGPVLIAIGTLVTLITVIAAGCVTAFTAISAAIVPIAAVVAIAISAFYLLKGAASDTAKSVVELSDGQKLVQKTTDMATDSIVSQKANLEILLATSRNENETKKERLKAIQAINRISPEYLGNLTLENINTDKARLSVEKYNTALLNGAKARAASSLMEANEGERIKSGFEREKALAQYNAGRKEAFDRGGWEEEKKFLEENNRLLQFANEKLDRKNSKYDFESKILQKIYAENKQYLDLLTEVGETEAKNANLKTEKKKPVERADIESINTITVTRDATGTIAAYDAEIAKLKQFRDEVATTADMVKVANDKITGLEFAKSLQFDPSAVIKSTETIAQMGARLSAEASGIQASLNLINTSFVDVSSAIQTSVQNFAASSIETFAAFIGNMLSGTASIGDLFKGMLGIVGDFMVNLGKSLIQVAIASAAFKKVLANPVLAIAAGAALIVFGTIVKNQLQSGPQAFANGGIVNGSSYYGDKILARVNSGELILNDKQQASVFGMMNAGGGGGGTIIPSVRITGSDLLLVFDRANKDKSRLS